MFQVTCLKLLYCSFYLDWTISPRFLYVVCFQSFSYKIKHGKQIDCTEVKLQGRKPAKLDVWLQWISCIKNDDSLSEASVDCNITGMSSTYFILQLIFFHYKHINLQALNNVPENSSLQSRKLVQ